MQVSFWLPFHPNYTGSVYTGCGGYSFDSVGCNAIVAPCERRFGTAGVLAPSGGNTDHAPAWFPLITECVTDLDIALVHQGLGVIGATNKQSMQGQYWLSW